MTLDEYRKYRENSTKTELNREDSIQSLKLLERVQTEQLHQLVADPNWNLYAEKLTELKQGYIDSVKSIVDRMLDTQRDSYTFEIYNTLRCKQAYSMGFIDAIDKALDLIYNKTKV